ncbi:MAG: LacI family DNA-binding transcriptional regulator [Chthoniobacterales bacterium]
MKKITPISQKKLAESLGMPKSTVANILNGTPHYKKETRERVFEAVKKFGYQPNRASRALKRGRSNLIGLIYFSSIYEVSRKAARHLPEIVNDFGFDYLVVDSY